MDYSAGPGGIEALVSRISSRVVLINLSAGLVSTGILALFAASLVPAFAAGFATGILNIFWLLKIAKRGVKMMPEKAGRFVMTAYPIRFAIVAALFALFIVKGKMSPWPLVAGFALSIAVTVCAMIYFAREEASHA